MPSASATKSRDLRAGRSLWLESKRTGVALARMRPQTRFEVVIVGAGISGAMLAYRLRRKGAKVLVLDRRPPLHGSTAASTALLQFEIDTPLFELARTIGRKPAERAWRRSVRAVAALRQVVAREAIACGWRDAHSLYLAGDAYGSRALRMEVAARGRAGVPGEFLSAPELRERFGIGRSGAILADSSAQADPMQLAAGLFRRALAAGVRIASPVTAKAVAADASGVILTTDDDIEIETRHAVFCTGYEILRSVPQEGHRIRATWAIASEPGITAPDWLGPHLVWEGSDPYLYVRRTRDNRIVAGGEDGDYTRDYDDPALLEAKTDTIAAKVSALIPGLRFRISHRWAGAFGETTTGLPFIDAVPGHPNCFAVMGYGGNGITYAMIASEVIAAALAGREDADADLYRFGGLA